jgi:hypothetical protein
MGFRSSVRLALTPFTWALSRFHRHHDELSVQRQRTVADLTLLANIILIALSSIAIKMWHWHLTIGPLALVAGTVVWGISIALLIAASSLPRATASFTRNLGSAPTPPDSPDRLAGARKFLFYPGTFLNFVAVCILVEESGGLVRSPFTPVLFAMALAAQQLGRFRTNSKIFISFGILATAALFLFERSNGLRSVAPPPDRLAFALLAAAFLVTAVYTHSDKTKNYRASGGFPPPTHVELYWDHQGVWRYVLHCKNGRLDPLLEDVSDFDKLEEAKAAVKRRIDPIVAPGTLVWSDSSSREEVMAYISTKK